MSSLVATGDVLRVRQRGTQDEWCVCQVQLVSPNGKSLALRILDDGVLRVRGGSMMLGLGVLIEDGAAYEIGTNTELEIDRWEAYPRCKMG